MRVLVLVAGCYLPGIPTRGYVGSRSRFQQSHARRWFDESWFRTHQRNEPCHLSLDEWCLDSTEERLVRWTPSIDSGRCDEIQLAIFSRAPNACNLATICVHSFPAGAFS